MASEAEQDVRFAKKRSSFRGSAKIQLKHLDYEKSSTAFLDPKNIARLVQIFRLEGCDRLDIEHRVPVLIDAQVLRQSLDHSRKSNSDLLGNIPPALSFPVNTQLKCLHGRHRLAAAKEFLEHGNKWWTVDFYDQTTLSEDIQKDIREDYANSRNFCDGDIFRQIRYCQTQQDQIGEGRWFARLSEGKRKDIKQLQRRQELRALSSAFDALLPFVGFWPDLQIGTFHRILNIRCYEELENYLNHIRVCWKTIVDGRLELQPLIDYQTVKLLQSRCPKSSSIDSDYILDSMLNRRLFPMIVDPETRSSILRRINEIDYLIPSLHTFLEDTKWLEPCAKILQQIFPKGPKGHKSSIRRSLLNCYTGVQQKENTFRVEQRNSSFTEQSGPETYAIESGYRQLWLFAWRNFPELSAILPRKDVGKPKPQAKASNEQCWQQLACLARSLGFDSDKIELLNSQDPDLRMALDFLSQARPVQFYHMSEDTRNDSAHRIRQVLESIELQTCGTVSELRVNDTVAIDHRCGRPFEQSYNDSKPWFFLGEIYSSRRRNSLSHFTVNRDIFLAFFGFNSHLEVVNGDLSSNLPAMWSNTTFTFSTPTNLPPASQPPIQSPQIFLPQSSQPPQFQPPPPSQQLQPQEAPPHPPPPEVPPPSEQIQPQPPPPPLPPPPEVPPPSQQLQPQEPPPQASPPLPPPQSPLPSQEIQPEEAPPHPPPPEVPPPSEQIQPQPPPPPPPPPEVPPPSQQLQPQEPPPQASPPLPPPQSPLPSQEIQPQEPPPPQAPQSPSQPQPPPQQSDLFDIYNKTCKEGDVFLVSIGPGAAKGEPVSLDNDTQRLLPNSITSRATTHKFMVYTQDLGLRFIQIANIRYYVKHDDWDGVIYMMGSTSNFAVQGIRGGSTKARLDQISGMSSENEGELDHPTELLPDSRKRKSSTVKNKIDRDRVRIRRVLEPGPDDITTTRIELRRIGAKIPIFEEEIY